MKKPALHANPPPSKYEIIIIATLFCGARSYSGQQQRLLISLYYVVVVVVVRGGRRRQSCVHVHTSRKLGTACCSVVGVVSAAMENSSRTPLRGAATVAQASLVIIFLLMLREYVLFVFCTLRQSFAAESHKLSFLQLGDWGKGGRTGQYVSALRDNAVISTIKDIHIVETAYYNKNNGISDQKQTQYNQMSVASAMAQTAALLNPAPSFVIALGDNFYDHGTPSSTDNIWLYNWKNVYISPYEVLDIPWYPVFGNRKPSTPSSTDNIWLYNWKNVYISPYEVLDIPWYPVFGNR
eukprot:gene37550-50688_t